MPLGYTLLGKVWEAGFNIKPRYLIEVISERYDRLNQQEKEKVIIHELLHIPKCFGEGLCLTVGCKQEKGRGAAVEV